MSSTSNESIIKSIRSNKELITKGLMLSIDPASNVCGYAIYIDGKLNTSGTVSATPKAPIHQRLHEIFNRLPDVKPDILVIELNRSGTGHVYLTWSTGVIIAKYGVPTIEIPQRMWKNVITESYEKSDQEDAILIGKYVVGIANGENIILKR